MDHYKLENVIAVAAEVVFTASRMCGENGKKGGCLCVTDYEGNLHLVTIIGEVSDKGKLRKYWGMCQEKANRLVSRASHESSWQSRDESSQQYGGAIRAREFILSFSGLPELWNEACMLALAYKVHNRLISKESLQRIQMINHNLRAWSIINATMDESEKMRA